MPPEDAAVVLAPALRPLPASERTALYDVVGRRFSVIGWISLVVLLVTGVGNVLFMAPSLEFLMRSRAGQCARGVDRHRG